MRAAALVLAAVLAGCAPPADRPIRVAAASSLAPLLGKALPEFERAHPQVRVLFSFDSSSTLARQAAEGAPYDAGVFAGREALDRCRERAARAPQAPLLRARLALLVAAEVPEGREPPWQGLRCALCAPEVPAGKAWREVLASRGGEPPGAVLASSAAGALALFRAGAVDAAFLYAPDALAAQRPHRTWSPAGAAMEYHAAVLRGPREAEAQAFCDWLASESFRAEARRAGFEAGDAR